MQPNSRRGFTRVELVVVIIIIVILLGLFLPAMRHSTDDTRRRMCRNGLKNLALATTNFEGTKNTYPGYQNHFGQSSSGSTNPKIGTWVVSLLPYIEQQPLADIWDDPTTNAEWANAAPPTLLPSSQESNVDTYYPNIWLLSCPSDALNDEPYAKNSYVANCGFWILSAPNDVRLSSAFGYTNSPDDILHSQKSSNGVFVDKAPGVNGVASGKIKSVSSKDITDGLSLTLMYSENMQADSWRSIVPETSSGSTRSHVGMIWHYRLERLALSTTRPIADAVLPVNRVNGEKFMAKVGDPEAARPSSCHPGVVMACMLDGSTRILDERMDYQVYQSLLTPQTAQSDVPNDHHRLTESGAFQ